ncbi:cation diffusion facilitator family transporter [Nitrospina gracilis]|uniref:cation diffusion facilitator family transporter n=1 Tax=Nitrospina gracilis TaxID=35801 RepID=UPI001F20A827|nr:cation diffusion facilitator family transporter [Nitrospina gracilis Nb-211]
MKPIITLTPATKAILVGALGNFVLSVMKIVAGMVGRSTALIADGVHSLSDLLTDTVVLFTYRISQIPADDNHPYGHGKVENIGSTIIGAVIITVGAGLIYESWHAIQADTQQVPTLVAAIVAGLTIVIKEGLYQYTRLMGEKESSPSVVAKAWDHRADAGLSLATLVGISGAMMGYPILDPIAAAVVAIGILHVGYVIVRNGIHDLMDAGMSESKALEITQFINSVPGVIRSHDLRSRKIGGDFLLDVHIQVDREASVTEGHQIAESVRRRLIREEGNIQDVMVHVDTEDDTNFEPIYRMNRGDLIRLADPVISDTPGVAERTQIRTHFHHGKVVLEVYVRLEASLSREQEIQTVQGLKERLSALDHVDEVRVYLETE